MLPLNYYLVRLWFFSVFCRISDRRTPFVFVSVCMCLVAFDFRQISLGGFVMNESDTKCYSKPHNLLNVFLSLNFTVDLYDIHHSHGDRSKYAITVFFFLFSIHNNALSPDNHRHDQCEDDVNIISTMHTYIVIPAQITKRINEMSVSHNTLDDALSTVDDIIPVLFRLIFYCKLYESFTPKIVWISEINVNYRCRVILFYLYLFFGLQNGTKEQRMMISMNEY